MNTATWQSVVGAWRVTSLCHPDAPAIRDHEGQWSYRRLQRRANEWSAQIASLPIGSGNAAIHFPHSAEAIAAALGVLVAGRTFVALDPLQPVAQRLAQLRFAEADILLASEEDASVIRSAGWSGGTISPTNLLPSELESTPGNAPDSRACLYFTSGSSGEPKAISSSHRTVAYAVECLQEMFTFNSFDRHAILAPLSVAASAAQVFAVLAAGGALCLREARKSTLAELARWLRREEITTMQTVPSLFRALACEVAPRKPWPTLRALKLGGETATPNDARLFAACAPQGALLINGLGLTEAGFNICWWKWYSSEPLDGQFLPIGRPPSSLELVVETSRGTAASNGEIGEIVVRSSSLAAGYWRDEERTAAVYRTLPDRPGLRELRTGDVGRWRSDGLLEYRGRLDDMVKIRGHRVDPAEVESALSAFDDVIAATVISKCAGDDVRLHAFVQLRPGIALKASDLQRTLAEKLPDYMVPTQIRLIDSLPLLPSGKVDRKALPVLAETPSNSVNIEPRDALERTLHGLFSQVLPRQIFGVTDSFFDLGGDSLNAAQLFAAIARVLNVEAPLADLKAHPTVEQLAARIRSTGWNMSDHPVSLLTPAPIPDALALFVWTGAGSDAMALSDLARHLGSAVALHAIQHRGADGRRAYDLSVDEMAERGVELIRRVQPAGPYALCGTSFGGIIALEVSRRFRAAGESISFLALLDTYGPAYPTVRRKLRLRDHAQLWLRVLRPIGHKDEPGLPVFWRGLREHAQRLLARRVIRKPAQDAPPLPMTERFLHLQQACFVAGCAYRPQSYDGDVHLFRVDAPPPAHLFEQDDSLGWRPWMNGRLHVEVIPGRHSWHLREPHVRTLAAKLGAALARAQVPKTSRPEANGKWDAAALWDDLALWWDAQIGDEGSELFRAVALDSLNRLIEIEPGERVLDIACGNGWLARKLARAGASVVALDISKKLLEHAQARSRGLPIEYLHADATNAEALGALGGEAFDLVICNMGVQDLSSVGPLFQGMLPALRKGGRFVLSMVHPASATRANTMPNIPRPHVVMPGQPRPHIEVLRPLPDLLRTVQALGWQVDHLVELPTPISPIFALISLRRPA